MSHCWHVLVVHHDTARLTARLLAQLPPVTPRGRPLLVHVLDNASAPDQLRLLRTAAGAHPHVTLHVSHENVGFGAGVNRLVAASGAAGEDVLWILNPDTELREGCLAALEAAADAEPDAILSPVIHTGDPARPVIWFAGGTLDPQRVAVRHHFDGRPPDELAASAGLLPTDFVTGAAPVLRRATWERVGPFGEEFFLYWEDALLSLRARQAGVPLYVAPDAVLWHQAGGSAGDGHSLGPTFYYWATRSRFVFAREVGVRRGSLLAGRAAPETYRLIARAALGPARLRTLPAALRGTAASIRLRHDTALPRLSVYPQVRSAHLEAARALPRRRVLYLRTHPDVDPAVVAAADGFRRVTPLGAARRVLTTRADVLELPEPLWLRWLPLTLGLAVLARLRRLLTRRPRRVVCYAMQNATPAQLLSLLSLLPRPLRPAAAFALRCSLALLARTIDRVAFATEQSQRTYDELAGGRWRVPECRVVDPLPPPCPCGPRAPEPHTVLFATGLEARKGLPQLLAAWPTVRTAVPDARLTVAGDGPLRDEVLEHAAADPSITYAGALDRAGIHGAFRRAGSLVLFSQPEGRWREQIGLPILEALAHGVPVVASDETGISDVLRRAGGTVLDHRATSEQLAAGIADRLRRGPAPLDVRLPEVDGRVRADRWLQGEPLPDEVGDPQHAECPDEDADGHAEHPLPQGQ